ncbi:unnamed protein product [Cuscuta epithymum]|uniref:U1-type domain-containing protein n=1 Tax=Cuscuta epithymum TaxID=186058 RepID=A0AAV0DBY3_9ASTE|nr:unnamed protein product [Cuscuta epithymum]
MDPSQHPPQPEQVSSEAFSALPSSQIQAPSYAHDPNQATYAYYPPSYQYSYYDPAQQAAYDYSNAYYQQPHQEQPTSTNPAQPTSTDPAAAAAVQYQYSYYQQPLQHGVEYGGAYGSVATTHIGAPAGQVMQPSSHRGGRGRRGGRGGGRGGGRRGPTQTHTAAQPSAPVWPPPRMAWCELCRVECNTPEILEQHKSGKKHLKNFKVQEELHRVVAAANTAQVQPSEGVGPSLPPPEVNASVVNEGGEGQVRGLKRKARGGGRGGGVGKSLRKKSTNGPKGGHIPLICELCNVTCETQLVFQTHLKGKKHIANRKRFEESEAAFGQAAAQALYPALQQLVQLAALDPQFLLLQQQQQTVVPGGGTQDLPLVFNQVPPPTAVTPPAAAEAADLVNPPNPPLANHEAPLPTEVTPAAAAEAAVAT